MTRWALVLAVVSCLTFASDPQEPARADNASIQGEDINLRMFSSRPTFGETEDPTFWVHAKRGRLLDDPRVWTLEDARAVIYRDPEEDLVVVAKSGTVDEETKSAHLDGDVRITSGRFVADVANIKWDNTTGVASSDSLATLDDGVNRLVGQSVALYTEEDRFELGEGSARIQLAQAQAEVQPATEKKSAKFESIAIPKYKTIVGNLAGNVREIQGPAELVLEGIDRADTLDIKADHITFEYAVQDDTVPAKIILKGNVALKHAQANIVAKEGTVDLVARRARFEGDVEMTGDQIEDGAGDYLDVNLESGDLELGGQNKSIGKIWLVPPKKAEKPAESTP